jgi:hypothetical protein
MSNDGVDSNKCCKGTGKFRIAYAILSGIYE